MKRGIDVSHHNVNFDFNKAKANIDFVMIRAGYGKNNIDREFERNSSECKKLKIPFGLYWFSYALNVDMAEKEADYVCDCALGLDLKYPIAFDFEYGSVDYMKKNGIKPTKELISGIAKAFLNRVEERGYYAIIYTNHDFLNQYFGGLEKRYSLWLAEWNVENPSMPCTMWQYGIDKEYNVDGNYCYKDFPDIISSLDFLTQSKKKRIFDEINPVTWNRYYHAAKTLMAGTMKVEKFIEATRNKGIDFNILNIVVNILKGE